LLEDHESMVAYSLAGTIALPSPYPATGAICIVPGPEAEGAPREIYLKVIHRVSYRLKVSRLVALDDVRAILAPSVSWAEVSQPEDEEAEGRVDRPTAGPETASPVPFSPQQGWEVKVAGEIRVLVDQWLEGDDDSGGSGPSEEACWLDDAIVYVPEAARVLMTVEAGMTAAESAEYYPPLATRQGQTVSQHPHMTFCEGRLPDLGAH
jgi:hypothetical protein